jgi:hypothetical protein
LLQRHLVEGSVLLEARVVDENVDGAELAQHPFEHCPNVIFTRHIRLMRIDPAAAMLALFNHLQCDLGIRAVVDDHVRPGMSQCNGDAFAYA